MDGDALTLTGKNPHATARTKTVNLALQGGGAHGAFTWGVLDRLLEDERIALEGISATSAGAMNGACLAYGMAVGGPRAGRGAVEGFWAGIYEAAGFCRLGERRGGG